MRRRTILAIVLAWWLVSVSGAVMAETALNLPAPVVPQLSADGRVLHRGLPIKAVIVDPDPEAPRRKIPPPAGLTTDPQAATASFAITYVPSGQQDLWSETCSTFPENAKAAFNAAAAIWANTISSAVPIRIRACWANLGDPNILGYSGGGNLYRDFSGAPRAGTWYAESLGNALHGSDMDATAFDMHITYNSGFTWYYGTDGSTPAGQYDLMTVVLHEIAHGLNFSGSMDYAGGTGSWGYTDSIAPPYYPNIYDVFMRDGAGNQLINTSIYSNPSMALGSVLVSGNLWFHGGSAMAANSGQRVRMYAPGTWEPGSSYSHLDYATFNDTPNELMVYSVSDGESIHDPGAVTRGLLKDLGWNSSTTPPPPPPSISFPWNLFLPAINNGESAAPPSSTCPAIPNANFESGHSVWTEYSSHGWGIITDGAGITPHSGSWVAWLGGEYDDVSYIMQSVNVSSSCPYLTFYYWIASADECGYDRGYVRINGTRVSTADLCESNNTGGWRVTSVNLGAYAGQTVSLQIRVETDGSLNSNLFVDDVSFQAASALLQPAMEEEAQPPPLAIRDAAASKSAVEKR